ncbi:MAG: hypothetical protein QOK28_2913 [Actinomycetota bacterium]|jgi:hypothetical protein
MADEAAKPASYERINYHLRPAKNIERKMMVEALRRLDRLTNLSAYRYVGFGSPYFADFSMIHKHLDITTLISIEREVKDKARFEFNKPYKSIEIRYGEATEVLPKLDWEQKSLVWLDYDNPLHPSMLGDIEGVVAMAAPWSVVIATFDADPTEPLDERKKELEARLPELVPPGVTDDELGEWGTADVTFEIVSERLKEAIVNRNYGKTKATHLAYQPLFHFRYKDGARMVTLGGVLVPAADAERFDVCGYKDVEFVSLDGAPYEIAVPKLTYRELDHLDAQFPEPDLTKVKRKGVPKEDVEKYSRVYRYFPRFVDAEH